MEAVNQQTDSSSVKMASGNREDIPNGHQGKYKGNLNVIPPQPGGVHHGNTRTASYIEYNDGKVCWYYPIFPELYNTRAAPGGPPERFRYMDGYEDYYCQDGDSTMSMNHQQADEYSEGGAGLWGERDFCFDEEWMSLPTSSHHHREGPDHFMGEFNEAPSNGHLPNPHYYNYNLNIYGNPTDRYPIASSSAQQSISYKYLPNAL